MPRLVWRMEDQILIGVANDGGGDGFQSYDDDGDDKVWASADVSMSSFDSVRRCRLNTSG